MGNYITTVSQVCQSGSLHTGYVQLSVGREIQDSLFIISMKFLLVVSNQLLPLMIFFICQFCPFVTTPVDALSHLYSAHLYIPLQQSRQFPLMLTASGLRCP